MNAQELRQKYIRFFESKHHQHHASGSLIPYDVTEHLDESLLFNGAGMVQFKPYFRGTANPPHNRLVTSQKCLRTGDIEEVGDASHLTFFEMLGNFSFGDYFKTESIEWAWEFLTSKEWLGIDPARLCTTVFAEDQEAYDLWAKLWSSAGFSPENRIFKLGEETNYWPAGAFSSGPPGPCGPNSEIFFWTDNSSTPKSNYTAEDYLEEEKQGKWLEIWNLVFIQYDWQGEQLLDKSYRKIGMPNLPFQSIDTGMGLERAACALGGFNTVYDTDVFQPIFRAIENVSEKISYGKIAMHDEAMRIIADHLRAACFCISDGILPSNTGRGYVLRRLIRRAVLKGQRTLGLQKPFLNEVVLGVLEAMGSAYIDLLDRKELLQKTLLNEEELFRSTLSSGNEILKVYLEGLTSGQPLAGDKAFRLYDTYGFPLEVTQELCAEQGHSVDLEGYQKALEIAQAISRGASQMDTVYGTQEEAIVYSLSEAPKKTIYLGDNHRLCSARIVAIQVVGSKVEVAFDQTVCYAESGGQVSDTGILTIAEKIFDILHVRKRSDVFWHQIGFLELHNIEKLLGQTVEISHSKKQRRKITAHHTATHLLHAALREVLGTHVTQAGSLVSTQYLRFDFTHGKALSTDELNKIEKKVNRIIQKNKKVKIHQEIPIEEARSKGAMALFGEKYGDKVRMVQVGQYSLELCGGSHVKRTGDIGLFKILHESSAASGVRRIEAIAGKATKKWVKEQLGLLEQSALLLKSTPAQLTSAIERLQSQNKELQRKLEKARTTSAQSEEQVQKYTLGKIEILTTLLRDAEATDATHFVDQQIANAPHRVVLVGWRSEDKAGFVCKAGSSALDQGIHAGNLVKKAALLTGGKGGGRAEFATAGAKDINQIEHALQEVVQELIR